ncbi:lipopolysaccharide assembly protein LapA domain-containing protein [Candidatus Omnitrophota bacterium]
MSWQWTVILLLMLLLVVFTVQNYEVVSIQLLFWSFSTSRAIVIFVTLIIGIVIGWTGSFIRNRDR